jgi:hypothetical protein
VAGWTKSEKIAAFSAAIAAVSAAGAILVFGLGVSQYRASENWKRSEFVAAQIKEAAYPFGSGPSRDGTQRNEIA